MSKQRQNRGGISINFGQKYKSGLLSYISFESNVIEVRSNKRIPLERTYDKDKLPEFDEILSNGLIRLDANDCVFINNVSN